jgi:hypothetical protein
MELWATGNNIWAQLDFSDAVPAIPKDLHCFEKIMEDESIEIQALYTAATIGKLSQLECLNILPPLAWKASLGENV